MMTKNSATDIGLLIQRIRLDNRLSQMEFAKMLNISQTSISSVEKGTAQSFNFATLIKISTLYNVSLKQLIDSYIATFDDVKFTKDIIDDIQVVKNGLVVKFKNIIE